MARFFIDRPVLAIVLSLFLLLASLVLTVNFQTVGGLMIYSLLANPAVAAARLVRGAAFFIDYGFPEHEYYNPQRHGGTLMCHQGHRSDPDPLAEPGAKDITATARRLQDACLSR